MKGAEGNKKKSDVRKALHDIVHDERFRKGVSFIIFVVIATVFWFILALNDNVQDNVEVEVNLENVPDSVTFINDVPTKIHVMVRDKGSNLMRNGIFGTSRLILNFRDYAVNGIFRVTRSELNGALKNTFGNTATIISGSVDSIRCSYTTLPGKRVPVVLSGKFTPASGRVISDIAINPSNALVFSTRSVLDTLTRIYTQKVSHRDLKETTSFNIDLHGLPDVRIQPGWVTVTVTVEPLVKKETLLTVQVDNAPSNVSLLLFPQRVRIEYYTPMSKYGEDDPDIRAWVDYLDIDPQKQTVPVHLGNVPRGVHNLTVKDSEIEYIIAHD